MSLRSSLPSWLRLPSRAALLLGVGALSATGAQAGNSEIDRSARIPQQSAKSFGEVRIWMEAGRIFVAELGKEAQELRLGETPEARRLRALLEQDGATAASPRILPDRMILVGGGGCGFDWAPADRGRTTENPTPPAATSFGSSNSAPQGQTRPPANSRLPGQMSPRGTDRG